MVDYKNVCSIIGDLKSSRELDNWEYVLDNLISVLEHVNIHCHEDIISSFSPTVGDAFQGVIKGPENAYEIFRIINLELEADFYCGMGVGFLEKDIRGIKEDIGMRGSSFYRANDALEISKKAPGIKKKTCRVNFRSSDDDNLLDSIINTLLYNIVYFEDSLTSRQKEITDYIRLNRDKTYKQVGKVLGGTTRQSVYNVLSASNFRILEKNEESVNKILKNWSKLSTIYNL